MRASWSQPVFFSESVWPFHVRTLLVRASLSDVGHGQYTDTCLEKIGHTHMGKTQIKKIKPSVIFFLLTSHSS